MFHRFGARASNTRFKEWSDIRKTDNCILNSNVGCKNLEEFSVGLQLAVFGIFLTVIFVYIAMEKKPLLG